MTSFSLKTGLFVSALAVGCAGVKKSESSSSGSAATKQADATSTNSTANSAASPTTTPAVPPNTAAVSPAPSTVISGHDFDGKWALPCFPYAFGFCGNSLLYVAKTIEINGAESTISDQYYTDMACASTPVGPPSAGSGWGAGNPISPWQGKVTYSAGSKDIAGSIAVSIEPAMPSSLGGTGVFALYACDRDAQISSNPNVSDILMHDYSGIWLRKNNAVYAPIWSSAWSSSAAAAIAMANAEAGHVVLETKPLMSQVK